MLPKEWSICPATSSYTEIWLQGTACELKYRYMYTQCRHNFILFVYRLDEKCVVRVGDFGLSRDVYTHLYYRADKHSKIPVKWSAPEMLNDGLCTEKSDVVGWHFTYTHCKNISVL